MRFASVQTSIWQNPNFRKLSKDLQILFFYLLSSPHSNMIGYYYLPIAYIYNDTQIPIEMVPSRIRELCELEDVSYDFDGQVVLLRKFLVHNKVVSDQQVKGGKSAFHQVPKGRLFGDFMECAKAYSPNLYEVLDTLSSKGMDTLSIPYRYKEQNRTEQVQEQKDPPPTFSDDKKQALAFINGSAATWPMSGPSWRELLEYEAHLPWAVIHEAVRRTLGSGGTSIRYCLGVLKRWKESGITSIEDIKAQDTQHENRKGASKARDNPVERPRVEPKELEYVRVRREMEERGEIDPLL